MADKQYQEEKWPCGSEPALDTTQEVTLCDSFFWARAKTLQGHLDSVNAAAWTRNGLLSVSDDCLVRGWFQGKASFAIREHTQPLYSVAASLSAFYTCGQQGLLSVYDTTICLDPVRQKRAAFVLPHSQPLHLLAVRQNSILVLGQSSLFLYQQDENALDLLSLQMPVLPLQGRPLSAVWKKDNAVFTDQKGGFFSLDGVKGRVTKVLKEERRGTGLNSVDGDVVLVGGGDDGMLGIFDTRMGRCVSSLFAHKDGVDAVSFHKERSLVSTGSRDGSIRTWELRRLRCLFETTCHRRKWDRGVCNLQEHPDIGAMVSCGADGQIIIFCPTK